MPDFTLTSLEERLSKRIGDHFAGTTDANGAATGLTLISDDLLRRPANEFVPWHTEISSGGADGEVRVNRQFTRDAANSDEPTITAEWAFTTQILSGVTFRIHRFRPDLKLEAIDEALRMLINVVPVIITEDFLAGQLLRNGNFELWRNASTLFDWAKTGTLARQTTTVYQGQRSAGLTGGSGQLSQRIPWIPELEGVTLTLKVWVNHTGATGSEVVARISVGSADNDNPVDPTQNTWTLLTATAAITDPSLPIVAKLLNSGTDIAYFDLSDLRPPDDNNYFWVPKSEGFQNIHDLLKGPLEDNDKTNVEGFRVHPMPESYDQNYGYWRNAGGLPYRSGVLSQPYHMRAIGVGRYPLLAAGTDTVELSEEEADYLTVEAGLRLLGKTMGAENISDREHWEEMRTDLQRDRAEMAPKVRKSTGGMRLR